MGQILIPEGEAGIGQGNDLTGIVGYLRSWQSCRLHCPQGQHFRVEALIALTLDSPPVEIAWVLERTRVKTGEREIAMRITVWAVAIAS